jgi:site-specific DNA-methyltransferase (adenine-specific)
VNLQVINNDFRDVIGYRNYKMIFADPPDNIGLSYDGYEDSMLSGAYRDLLWDTLHTITRCEILWVSFNPNHMNLMGQLLYERGWNDGMEVEIRWFIQHVTFGYYMAGDFGRCFRPMVRVMRKGAKTYPDAIRVQSERQRMGDKRADPRGKVPGDCWTISRVTGNSKQRRRWHNTQLNEELYERCILFSTKPGDHIADLYAGTGTMARVCKNHDLELSVDLFDVSETYCHHIADEFDVDVRRQIEE